jgi:hypothetical protein
MSWAKYRIINNYTYINKQNKVIFIQLNDTEYLYDDELSLMMFSKMKQDGNVDVTTNGIVKVSIPTKIMIELNIFYTYTDTDFAPRYELNIYKNNLIVNKYYCGMNDTTDTINNLYIISVIDVSNDALIKIVMSKDNIENSTNHIKIMKNSFINYKTF